MEQTFLTELKINKVRHLRDITIPLSKTERKNLILTGKNGSGKTSVLNEIAKYLELVLSEKYVVVEELAAKAQELYLEAKELSGGDVHEVTAQSDLYFWAEEARMARENMPYYNRTGSWNTRIMLQPRKNRVSNAFSSGRFVVAYYVDNRIFEIERVEHIEKVRLKKAYGIREKPSTQLEKYLADLKFTRLLDGESNNSARASRIEAWFDTFENILRRIYGENSLRLHFDGDTYQYSILIDGREPFDFNTMSMGYAAVFDIVADLMMRMESQRRYDLEGIVLIDEIETHLHVELQKQIVGILTDLFPNIQFIMTTHSPFILNSTPNAVIYDLEKRLLVEDGMENLSYEGIVEGYFEVDQYSKELRDAFEEYKKLVMSDNRTDAQCARLAALRDYLDEVPDYLAREIAYEYALLKLEHDD